MSDSFTEPQGAAMTVIPAIVERVRLRASKIEVGSLVVVGARFAIYTHHEELEGRSVRVINVTSYPNSIVGITLDGCPEVCSSVDAMIEVEVAR